MSAECPLRRRPHCAVASPKPNGSSRHTESHSMRQVHESRDGSIHRRTVMTSALALVGAAYAAPAGAAPARNSSLADTVVKQSLADTVAKHLQAIQSRDLPGLESTLTSGEQLDLFLPSGVHLATRQAYLELHREWFADPGWSWSCTPVTQVVSDDLAVVTVRSRSETARDDQPPVEVSETWVTLTFRRETGRWALVHDQNTRIASG